MRKTILLSSVLAVSAAMLCLARPIRGASAASSEEFPSNDPLPYDAEVQYLECDGTNTSTAANFSAPYIDTGVVLYEHSGIFHSFRIFWTVSDKASPCAPGAWGWHTYNFGGSQYTWLGMVANRYSATSFKVNFGTYNSGVSVPASSEKAEYLFDSETGLYKNGELIVEGSVALPANPPSEQYSIRGKTLPIFITYDMRYGYNPSYPYATLFRSGSRYHRFIIEIDGEVVRDYIPVRFTNENYEPEGALYDQVSGELFRNAGIGSFTIGPDKE